MTPAKIYDFPQDETETWAACPECEGTEFHLILDAEAHLDKIRCANDECGWEGGMVRT